MSICVGSGYCISSEKIRSIFHSDTPPEMSLWEKIKEFFFSTHQTEVQDYIYRLTHPFDEPDRADVIAMFNRLKEIVHPGYVDRIRTNQYGLMHFSIMDNDGDELLVVSFMDGYTVELTDRQLLHVDGYTRISNVKLAESLK